jgi:hypothetical protein
MQLRRTWWVPLSMALTACGGATEPASAVAGDWAREQSVLGSRLEMTLVIDGQTVSGTGTYAIEAGRSGSLTIGGTYVGGKITLDLAYDYDDLVYHFEGHFTSSNRLMGTIRLTTAPENQALPVAFKRT